MDIKEIQDLIKFVQKSGVNEVSIEENDFKITIKTNQAPTLVTATIPAAAPAAAAPAPVAASPAAPAPAAAPASNESDNYLTIKSPASPDKPAFVNVGDEIKAGQVLCVVEAMKLFNEIEAEISGRIVKVLVDNASPIEFDQPLFLVEPV